MSSDESGESHEKYTLQVDKACKLLRVLHPALSFMNCPPFLNYKKIAEQLNGEFNVKDVGLLDASDTKEQKNNIRKLQEYINKHKFKTPLILVGFTQNSDIINEIFGEYCFTYIFIYPPDPKTYESVITESMKTSNELLKNPTFNKNFLKVDSKTTAESIRKKVLKISLDTYKNHSSVYDLFVIKLLLKK